MLPRLHPNQKVPVKLQSLNPDTNKILKEELEAGVDGLTKTEKKFLEEGDKPPVTEVPDLNLMAEQVLTKEPKGGFFKRLLHR